MNDSLYTKYLNLIYFDKMIEEIKFHSISVYQYGKYYSRLNQAINKKTIESPFKYILELLNATVHPIKTKYDDKKYTLIHANLLLLFFIELKKPDNIKILHEYYEIEFTNMKKGLYLNNISFDMFLRFNSLINMALNFPTKLMNEENISKLILSLTNANVTTTTTNDFIQLNKLKQDLVKKYKFLSNKKSNKIINKND